jgi:hypothetical protein
VAQDVGPEFKPQYEKKKKKSKPPRSNIEKKQVKPKAHSFCVLQTALLFTLWKDATMV